MSPWFDLHATEGEEKAQTLAEEIQKKKWYHVSLWKVELRLMMILKISVAIQPTGLRNFFTTSVKAVM